jgi:prepilin signal peptidase PulO-like enzyme (type II secretory pathway)
MSTQFFPNASFGWFYVVSILGLLAVCAVVDAKRLLVPKVYTLGLAALGLGLNMVRGGWLGANELNVWLFGPAGIAGGVADGVLFAIAGLLTGFTLFFLQWILTLCGGGDVKLAAGLGACLGPMLFLVAFILTLPAVVLLALIRAAGRILQGQRVAHYLRAEERDTEEGKRKRRIQSYSLPLALGTALMMLGLLGTELGIFQPKPIPGKVAPTEKAAPATQP